MWLMCLYRVSSHAFLSKTREICVCFFKPFRIKKHFDIHHLITQKQTTFHIYVSIMNVKQTN